MFQRTLGVQVILPSAVRRLSMAAWSCVIEVLKIRIANKKPDSDLVGMPDVRGAAQNIEAH